MSQPLLSICIPTYNRACALWRTLNSITTQKGFLFTDMIEIVISDNCSTDATEEVCEEFVKKYPSKVRYIKRDMFVSGDENFIFVVRQAKGKFIKLHNDTCYILENSMDKIIEDIKRADELDCNGCFFANTAAQKEGIAHNFDELILNVSYFITWIASHCYRKTFLDNLDNLNRYSHLNFAQVDIAGRLFEAGGKIYVSNKPYFTTLYVLNKGGYNVAKVFGYNYFYILNLYKKKGLLSSRVIRKDKRKTLNKHIINFFFDYSGDYSFKKDGYFRYMRYFWFKPYFYLSYLKIFKSFLVSCLPKNIKKRKKSKRLENIWKKQNFDNHTELVQNGSLSYNIAVGKCSYGRINAMFSSDNPVMLMLGNYVSVAPNVLFIPASEHNYKCLSTFPFKVMCSGEKCEALSKGSIIIEDDVWIGANSVILSGVRIGQGAVIAAGSVIAKDVEPYSIVAGNPAKFVKYRFDKSIIERLLQFNPGMLTQDVIQGNIDAIYKNLTDENVDSIINLLEKQGNL